MLSTQHTKEIPPLREMVESSFRRSGYSPLRGICCHDRGGALMLRGRLPSHYLKQLALAVATELAGATPILLEIVVEGSPRLCESRRGHGVESVSVYESHQAS